MGNTFFQIIAVLFDGFAFGMLLFIISIGLTVTMGLMNFVNLSHGAMAMLGGYCAVVVTRSMEISFYWSLPAAFIFCGLVGGLLERSLFRHLYRSSDLVQVVFTIGLVFVLSAIISYFFGPSQQSVLLPVSLQHIFRFGSLSIPAYKIFLTVLALLVTSLVVLGLQRTRFGIQIQAAVDNYQVANGIGINVAALFAATFAIGSGLAGLGGALAVEVTGVNPNFGMHYLIYVLIVVSVGGLGSVTGSFLAAALLGIVDVTGKFFAPGLGAFLIYFVVVAIMLVSPRGVMGRR